MSINLEKTVKDWIDADPDGDGLTAYLEVPADRPKRLVTIERVGGNENEYSSHPTIAAVSVESVIDFPDPGPPPQPRYQITIQLDAATQ